jgi:hypothetical protein
MPTPILIEPEFNIPLDTSQPFDPNSGPLLERAKAACRAIKRLNSMGMELPEPTQREKEDAALVVAKRKQLTPSLINKPGFIIKLDQMLEQYDYQTIQSREQGRNFTTNRLLEEADNADPRVRLKALELLGKAKGIDLFTEHSEVTVRHTTSEELETLLKEKLSRVVELNATDYQRIEEQQEPSEEKEVDDEPEKT